MNPQTFTALAEQPITIVLAALVAILGAGRLTRIIFWDSFPPAVAFRMAWDKLTIGNSWNILFHCPWCLAPWVMLACIGWFALGTIVFWVAVVWWVFWGWLALSYVASMVVVRDEPEPNAAESAE